MVRNLLTLPGDITSNNASSLLQGRGTYVDGHQLKAGFLGTFKMVNQLAYVEPIHGRYNAQIGDVVVGVVRRIRGKCWYMDIGAPARVQLSILQVNTEKLANRRKGDKDIYDMRKIFAIGDAISCEVQRISARGTIMLQTRTSKYGRLTNGVLVRVKPNLLLRQSKHMHDLQCGVRMIFGCNGFIWISRLYEGGDAATQLRACHDIYTFRRIILTLSGASVQISLRLLCEIYIYFRQRYPTVNILSKDFAPELLDQFLTDRSM
ncbi:Exosome complex component RRP4 [Babesia sp. Xinjiang]|uniref:Exosome complex component RRP4 n=1 Tax=Babesia sp. Xinjiang TaxID=462227 RepID=UPI000A236786|nr:Exosome complex component RRP4 [Babesia sp. Xinjiang]ORM41804.1 Exosome complex component RRP4 [Babesia sp. Xinjiang]